jgi:hypothetical protein
MKLLLDRLDVKVLPSMKDDPATFSVINKQLITMIKDFNEWKYKNNLTYITGIVTNISLVFCNFDISNLKTNLA